MRSHAALCQLPPRVGLKHWHLSEREFWSILPRRSQKSHLTSDLLPCPSYSSKDGRFLTGNPYSLPSALESIISLNFEFQVLEAAVGFAEIWASPSRKTGLFPVPSHLTIRKLNHSSSSAHPDRPKLCILKTMTQFFVKQHHNTKAFKFTFQRHECKNHCLNVVPSAAESRPPIYSPPVPHISRLAAKTSTKPHAPFPSDGAPRSAPVPATARLYNLYQPAEKR